MRRLARPTCYALIVPRPPATTLERHETSRPCFGLKGGSVVAQLEVKNPNPFTLSTRSIEYKFEVLDATKSDTSLSPASLVRRLGLYFR